MAPVDVAGEVVFEHFLHEVLSESAHEVSSDGGSGVFEGGPVSYPLPHLVDGIGISAVYIHIIDGSIACHNVVKTK